MQIQKAIRFRDENYSGEYEEPSLCPICKHALKPQELNFHPYFDENKQAFLSVTYLCKHCYQPFVVFHSVILSHSGGGLRHEYTARIVYIEPNRFRPMDFDAKISALSPQFVKIYNQALAAESSGLDEIAGLGYRKAVEFLIKDFCIHQNESDEDKIKKLPLGKCIENYVKNEQINTLATRAAWIGNDEAHYIRKQEDRDISDMKSFIQAMVYFVGMVLIAEDAASISPV